MNSWVGIAFYVFRRKYFMEDELLKCKSKKIKFLNDLIYWECLRSMNSI